MMITSMLKLVMMESSWVNLSPHHQQLTSQGTVDSPAIKVSTTFNRSELETSTKMSVQMSIGTDYQLIMKGARQEMVLSLFWRGKTIQSSETGPRMNRLKKKRNHVWLWMKWGRSKLKKEESSRLRNSNKWRQRLSRLFKAWYPTEKIIHLL